MLYRSILGGQQMDICLAQYSCSTWPLGNGKPWEGWLTGMRGSGVGVLSDVLWLKQSLSSALFQSLKSCV